MNIFLIVVSNARKRHQQKKAQPKRKHEEPPLIEQKKVKLSPSSSSSFEKTKMFKKEERPSDSIRFDNVNHLPYRDSVKSASRCKNNCDQYTHVFCGKCKVHLCFTSQRNCFATFHGQLFEGNKKACGEDTRPERSIRYDDLGHFAFLDSSKSATRCKNNCKQQTHVFCKKCSVHLCFTSSRNCFVNFHSKTD